VFPRDEGENVRAGLVNKYKITVGLGWLSSNAL
jgi:hypothetical protein